MTYLLDVNVLIALLDPLHIHHGAASDWFVATGSQSWATSPIVQNGAIRIIGSAGYSNVPFGSGAVADLLADWCEAPGHRFWSDDISLLDDQLVERQRLTGPKRITDTYLLALACRHGGKLATLDRRLAADAVRGGQEALHVIG